MRLQDLIGIYYVYDYQTRSYGQEYILEIIATNEDKVEFVFIKKVRRKFGNSDITWQGICNMHDNKLTLETLENKNSNLTSSKGNNAFNFEILKEKNNIILKLVQYEKTINLAKLDKKIDKNKVHSIASEIIRQIINQYKLLEGDLDCEPERFWRISNLLIKSYNEIKINQKEVFEVKCEYDLELVKEEKRVVNNDEILAKNHLDKAIFHNNLQIIKYENIK
jgi:hypothetical protein